MHGRNTLSVSKLEGDQGSQTRYVAALSPGMASVYPQRADSAGILLLLDLYAMQEVT
jgi:hypothetical protein